MGKPGRKSKAEDRRREIVQAVARCVREHGIGATSVAKFAREAGVPTSLVFHYFGDRDALILALIDYEIEKFDIIRREGLVDAPARDRLDRLLGYFLGGGFYEGFPDDGVIWSEITAISGRNEAVRERLSRMWADWLAEIDDLLAAAYPACEASVRGAVAYGLVCIVEESYVLRIQGMTGKQEIARQAAGMLLAQLQPPIER